MSLIVYAYVLLLTVIVASAAVVIEWGARGRIPVRHIWSAAIWIALLAPPVALTWHAVSAKPVVIYLAAMPNQLLLTASHAAPKTVLYTTLPINHRFHGHALLPRSPMWRMLAAGLSTRLGLAVVPVWICASAAFIVWLLMGALHWRRARRSWHPAIIDGVPVEISSATGPAVLGVIAHRIVMPAWAMSMPLERRKLMLAHECEHVSARDPERLALAVVALVLMPWNAGLWWCVARLRRAIELDCDARVLRRYPGTKEYGHLLLDVASRGHGFGSMRSPSMALLHVSSELELRVRAMTQPRRGARRAIVAGAGITVIAVTAAFTTPVPELPVLRSSVTKANSAGTPQPTVMLHHVTVKVGRSQVIFDSAMYSPETHRDSIVVLRPRADSLRFLSSQLAARTHELGELRARLDSAQHALQATHAQLSSINVSAGSSASDYTAFARKMDAERVLREKYLPPAIDQNYPGISKFARPGMLLWFVVDSSGRVIRTARDESFNRAVPFSAERVSERFSGIAPHDISSTSVSPKMIGDAAVTVVWATERKP